ncbi:MAG: outer membrane lipoprotein-sorting protein [Thermoanaerobaculia bacterium]
MSRRRFPLAALLLATLAFPAMAEEARALLQQSEDRHRTKSQEYEGDLTVTAKDGKERKKSWRSYRLGYAGDSRLLIRFTAPPEVKGVGFLSLPRPGKNPDQWLYLPSMKRERRIAAQDRSASFVGTDFNYEDMEELDHEKYDVRLLPDETVAGQPCWAIEARPRADAGKSLYERKLLFLRKDILYLVRMDLFRPGEKEPGKRLLLEEVALVDGHHVARRMTMKDLAKGSTTVIRLEKLAFDGAQPEGRYTLQNLVREGGD